MTKQELLTRVSICVAEITEEDAKPIDEAAHLEALGLDSLGLAELSSKLSRELKVVLMPADLHANPTVGALLDLVLSRMPPSAAAR